MTTLPEEIWINVWKNIKYPEELMLLYTNQLPFINSPTLNRDWVLSYSFKAINPMIRPFPEGTQLYLARHKSYHPYNLDAVETPIDNFEVGEYVKGTWFINYNSPYRGLEKLPFDNINIYSKKIERNI